MGDILIIAVLVLTAFIPIALIVGLIIGIIKKKKAWIIVSSTLMAVCAVMLLFVSSHQIDYRYNDWWVLGKNKTEIEQRYDTPDIKMAQAIGYFICHDNGWIMPDHLDHYYYIEFDNNGKAISVRDNVQPGG